MMISEGAFPFEPDIPSADSISPRIISLKEKINDDEYLYEAIQRIAQVISNEIVGGTEGGGRERKG